MSNSKRKDLILICRSDEPKAVVFDLLVKNQRYEVIYWLKSKFSRLTLSDCEDIFQDASCALWTKLQTMHDWKDKPIIGLMKVICRNLATHLLRGMAHYEEWSDTYYPEETAIEMDYGFISPEFYRKTLKEQMYQMIDRLAPQDNRFMKLYLDGMSMKEISRKLGFKAEGTSKNKKCKIVARLCKERTEGQADACPSLFLYTYHDSALFSTKSRNIVSRWFVK